MSVWKTADEARKICEEYENHGKLMLQARYEVAGKIEKSLKSHGDRLTQNTKSGGVDKSKMI